jgi:DNA replication protein DnaC
MQAPAFVCEACDNTGWVYTMDAAGVRRATRCADEACLLQRRAGKTPQVPGMPQEFVPLTLPLYGSKSSNREALEAAEHWLRGHHDLFITGAVGTGKTALACALANERFKQDSSVRFTYVGTLLERHKAAMFEDDAEKRRAGSLDPFYAVRLLVLDDVGRDKGSDYARMTLQTIYDERRARGNRTIWTSNLDLGQLGEFFEDDRLPSRIAGAAEIVFLGGEDWRAQGWKKLAEAKRG